MIRIRSKVIRALELADNIRSSFGWTSSESWESVLHRRPLRLYAGKLRRSLPQYGSFVGITPFFRSPHNIYHDITCPYPIPDNIVDIFQSEDVFEHIELDKIPSMLDEIYRILKPGGLFRLSVPDYNFDMYRNRTLKRPDGTLLFDAVGGGRLVACNVVDGGHVWFPTIKTLRSLFAASRFGIGTNTQFLHYTNEDGTFVCDEIDHSFGRVGRTPENDPRVADRPRPLSIVIDARK